MDDIVDPGRRWWDAQVVDACAPEGEHETVAAERGGRRRRDEIVREDECVIDVHPTDLPESSARTTRRVGRKGGGGDGLIGETRRWRVRDGVVRTWKHLFFVSDPRSRPPARRIGDEVHGRGAAAIDENRLQHRGERHRVVTEVLPDEQVLLWDGLRSVESEAHRPQRYAAVEYDDGESAEKTGVLKQRDVDCTEGEGDRPRGAVVALDNRSRGEGHRE